MEAAGIDDRSKATKLAQSASGSPQPGADERPTWNRAGQSDVEAAGIDDRSKATKLAQSASGSPQPGAD
ncbi:MAG: hypothetical protein K1Y01_05730, partial [Vicinamibacteria bacterium]|nr:hypothetical protein [Vicinamibacteria bacterium]